MRTLSLLWIFVVLPKDSAHLSLVRAWTAYSSPAQSSWSKGQTERLTSNTTPRSNIKATVLVSKGLTSCTRINCTSENESFNAQSLCSLHCRIKFQQLNLFSFKKPMNALPSYKWIPLDRFTSYQQVFCTGSAEAQVRIRLKV